VRRSSRRILYLPSPPLLVPLLPLPPGAGPGVRGGRQVSSVTAPARKSENHGLRRHSIVDEGARVHVLAPSLAPTLAPRNPSIFRRIRRKTPCGGQGAKLFPKGGSSPASRPLSAAGKLPGILTRSASEGAHPALRVTVDRQASYHRKMLVVKCPLPTFHCQEDQPRGSRSSTRREPSFAQNSADSLKRIKGIKRINKGHEGPLHPSPQSLISPLPPGEGSGVRGAAECRRAPRTN